MPTPRSPKVPLSRALLDDEGGFALWRAHLVDAHGNGALLSWGFGAPEARQGAPGPARAHPFLSLLLFAGGQPMVWLSQRYPEADASWDAPMGRWVFGKSQIEALRDLQQQVVIARLDCPLPGTTERLTGTLEVAATPPNVGETAEPDGAPAPGERWASLTGPGKARCALQVGDRPFTLIGTGHHAHLGHPGTPAGGSRTSGLLLLDERALVFEARGGAAPSVQGLLLDPSGGATPSADLALEGDIGVLEGEAGTLTLREDGEPWLKLSNPRVIHERPGGRDVLFDGRARMAVPRPGVLRVTFADQAQGSSARRFHHDVAGPNPWRTRAEVGVQQDRWRRLVPLAR